MRSAPYNHDTIAQIRKSARGGSTLAQVADTLGWDVERLRKVCRLHLIDLPEVVMQPEAAAPKGRAARDPVPYRQAYENRVAQDGGRDDGPLNRTISIVVNNATYDLVRTASRRHNSGNAEILRRVLIGAIRDGLFDSYCAGSSYFPGSKVASASSETKTED